MANEIKSKYSTVADLTMTLASLATSTAGVGRQSTMVDNSTDRFEKVAVFVQVKQGTSPTGNRAAYVYGIRSDKKASATHRSDNAGASDAAFTVQNAQLLGVMRNKSAPSTGDVLYGEFIFDNPGPEWGIAVVHDTGVNLDSTEGNHIKRWIGINPEVQ